MAKAKNKVTPEDIKKYAFWACMVLVILIGFVVNWFAVARVSTEFTNTRNDLELQKSNVERLRNDMQHPNQRTIDEVVKKTDEERLSVSAAWQILRQDQERRSEWPAEKLGPVFMNEIRTKKFGDEITDRCREIYREFINDSLPALESEVRPRRVMVKNAQGEWEPLPAQGAGSPFQGMPGGENMSSSDGGAMGDPQMPGGMQRETKFEGVLDWPTPEIYRIKGYWNDTTPGSGEIWYTQEDLWVYGALLSVIKRVNVNATGLHNATIKRIESLWIGQQASQPLWTRSKATLSSTLAGGGSDGMMEGMSSDGSMSGEMSGSDMMSGDMMSGGEGAIDFNTTSPEKIAIDKIRNYRYVGREYEPLKAVDPVPYREFNRMPVCLRLVVDQNKIPEILVEFANCPMPMDVLWVRLNPPMARSLNFGEHFKPSIGAGVTASSGYSSDGSSSDGGGSSSNYSSSSGSSSSSSSSGSSSDGGGSDSFHLSGSMSIYGSESVPIEIYGVINIFNSPEQTPELRLSKPTEQPEGENAAPPENTTTFSPAPKGSMIQESRRFEKKKA